MFGHQKLIVYQLSLEAAKMVPAITSCWNRGHSYLTDQLKRAISSVALNISEGNGRRSLLERRRFFDIARASAAECSAIMDIALAVRIINRADFEKMTDYLSQIYKILFKLK